MDKAPTIRDLYPSLNEEQLREAEENLGRYLELVLRIYERISSDPASYAQFQTLTAKNGTLSCTPPRSNCLSADDANPPT